MSKLDFVQLQADIHALAREKGWYEDRDMSDPEMFHEFLGLASSELAEALECYREGKMLLQYDGYGKYWDTPVHSNGTLLKPVGFPSEIADIVIRCLDTRAAYDMPAPEPFWATEFKSCPGKRLTAKLHKINGELIYGNTSVAIAYCYGLARDVGFDLDEAIIRKHAYNKTRPKRHGGKKC